MDSFESNISPGQANPSFGVELRKRTSKSVQDEYYAEMLHEEDVNELLSRNSPDKNMRIDKPDLPTPSLLLNNKAAIYL